MQIITENWSRGAVKEDGLRTKMISHFDQFF